MNLKAVKMKTSGDVVQKEMIVAPGMIAAQGMSPAEPGTTEDLEISVTTVVHGTIAARGMVQGKVLATSEDPEMNPREVPDREMAAACLAGAMMAGAEGATTKDRVDRLVKSLNANGVAQTGSRSATIHLPARIGVAAAAAAEGTNLAAVEAVRIAVDGVVAALMRLAIKEASGADAALILLVTDPRRPMNGPSRRRRSRHQQHLNHVTRRNRVILNYLET